MTTRWVPGLLLALSLTPARSATYRVSPSPPGPAANGLTWATAFPTVQQALDAAESSDEVWVAAGTYQENLTLRSGIGLYGGFAGTEASREQRSLQGSPAVLDGQGKGSVVSIAKDANSQTVLDGFSIVNGLGPVLDIETGGAGGGVFVSGGTPIISNNGISGCSSQWKLGGGSKGGGIYVAPGGMPLVVGNTIAYNQTSFAAGAFAWGGLFRDNTFAYNVASDTYYGGGSAGALGIHNGVAIHNQFVRNDSLGELGAAGAVFCVDSLFIDNTLVDNTATNVSALGSSGLSTVLRNTIFDSYAGGVEIDCDSGIFSSNLMVARQGYVGIRLGYGAGSRPTDPQPIVTNNTICNLEGKYRSYGVASGYANGERPVFANNIVTGWMYAGTYGQLEIPPTFTTDHNNTFGNTDNSLPFPGTMTGNISLDPLYADPAKNNFQLQAGSPCIDAGNDATVASGDRDLLGAPRIAGAHVDIGCYEYGSPAWTMLDAAEVLKVAAGLSLATPAELSRLDVAAEDGATGPCLTVLDATRIAGWLLN